MLFSIRETILINRGWVPNDMKNPKNRSDGQVTHEMDLIGTVRFSENRPQFMPKNVPEKGVWFYKYVTIVKTFTS